jgi:peptidoglycan/LPS O-acetylase OafA/YrhL
MTIVLAEALQLATPLAGLIDATAASIFLVFAAVEIEGGRLVQAVQAGGHRCGEMSYTLYAIHLPVLLLLCAALNEGGSTSIGIKTFGLFLAILLMALAVAFALSLITERRTNQVRAWLAARVRSARRLGPAIASARGVTTL